MPQVVFTLSEAQALQGNLLRHYFRLQKVERKLYAWARQRRRGNGQRNSLLVRFLYGLALAGAVQ